MEYRVKNKRQMVKNKSWFATEVVIHMNLNGYYIQFISLYMLMCCFNVVQFSNLKYPTLPIRKYLIAVWYFKTKRWCIPRRTL